MVSIDLRFVAPSAVPGAAAAAAGGSMGNMFPGGPAPAAASPPAAAGGGGSTADIIAKTMLRPRDEPLNKTLARMRMLCAPPRNKKQGKLSQAQILQGCPEALLLDEDGQPIDGDIPTGEAWPRASSLIIGDATVRVKYNIPTVTGVTAPSVVYGGLPAVVTGINVLFSDKMNLNSEWRVSNKAGTAADESIGVIASNSQVVTPKPEWVGRKLLFRCRIDGDDCLWTEVETPAIIKPDAGFGPIARADDLRPAPKNDPSKLRVVSYNVLHDSYANSKSGQSLIYPFCTKEVLSLSYRRSRVAQELAAFDADIVCLQEVGRDVFFRFYRDIFTHWGYAAHLGVKTGNTKEGCAIAFRSSRFEMVDERPISVPLNWRTMRRDHPEMAAEIKAEHPHLLVGLKRVPSVGIAVRLRDTLSGKLLVVSNTHLYYHPNGCHIRALQFFMLQTVVRQAAQDLEDTNPGSKVEIVAPGDYNFTRTTGGYRLATTGGVMPDDTCWQKGLKHYWGMDRGVGAVAAHSESEGDDDAMGEAEDLEALLRDDDDVVGGAVQEVREPSSDYARQLKSAPTRCYMPRLKLAGAGEPLVDSHPGDEYMRFTNYALSFKECIDHIFTSPGLECDWRLRQPTEQELAKDIAIPSLVFPSDHVALVADFKYRDAAPAAAAADDDPSAQ